MTTETRACQNCKDQFTIEPEDFQFYEKMRVPPPTFCPECLNRRRMMWRNEQTLYKRKCDAPGHEEELVTIYAPGKPVHIYDQKYWWSDAWDPRDFGSPYDFSKPFFEQFQELFQRIPLLALSNSNAVNSDYCNVADLSKDSYLTSGSYKIERTLYANRVHQTTDCADLYVCSRCELCYECVSCTDSYRLFWSRDSNSCRNSYFLYDCRNCSDCVGCTNLRNKQYCIFNQQFSKEDYIKAVEALDLGSREGLARVAARFKTLLAGAIHRYASIQRAVNSTGDHLDNVKNCHYVFDIFEGMEDCKYSHWGGMQTRDVYDGGPGVGDATELLYEVTDTGLQSADVAFTNVTYGSRQVRYALYIHNCKDIFGCIGLRNKRYCILNKQYTESEYKELLPKVLKHMDEMPYVDRQGRTYKYGEFFPEQTAPMAYNESIAQDYFPLQQAEAERRG